MFNDLDGRIYCNNRVNLNKGRGTSVIGYPPLLRIVSYLNAGVAQLAEHQPSKLRVAGSIPVSRSIMITYIVNDVLI